MSKKYTIGLDYGTESGRAVLVDVSNGEVVAQCTKMYTHGVMDEYLPDGSTKLPMDFALQHPMDYLEVAELTVPAVLKEAGVSAEAVVGLSTDFTSCTILPIDAEGTPLCVKPQFVHNPHAYVKLWKHHAAQPEANVVTELAEQRGEGFLARYGGKISSEWLQPKIMQILDEAPEVFDAADRIIEAADWLNLMLTGEERRSSCMAGYKGMWHKKDGYPTKDFMAKFVASPKINVVGMEEGEPQVANVGEVFNRIGSGLWLSVEVSDVNYASDNRVSSFTVKVTY